MRDENGKAPTRRDPSETDEGARSRAEQRLHTFIGSVLVFAIVLMANYLSFRHYTRWDWTTDARYTLSERSLEVVRGLDRDVELILLASEGEQGFADVHELAGRYDAESSRLTVRHLDPDRQPAEVRDVAQRYDIALRATGEGATLAEVAGLVVSGERTWKITRDDLFRVDFSSMESDSTPQMDVEAERAITGAIVQVLEGRKTHVCLTSGHGEWTLGGGDRSLPIVREELARENTELQTMDPLAAAVPDECDAVFVVGPQRPFRDDEVRTLLDWVEAGGRLLLALDPNPNRDGVLPSGFEERLAELGILVDASIFIETDPARLLSPDPTDQILVLPQAHETTQPALARGGPFLVSLARTVRAEPGSAATSVLGGSEGSFGKVDLATFLADADLAPSADDIPAPASIGAVAVVAVEGEGAREGRVVVIGDSDWMRGAFLSEPRFANLELLMAWTGWLTDREALISIPPRRSALQAIVMSEADMTGIWWRVVAFLPGAMLLLGFAAWWSRRS